MLDETPRDPDLAAKTMGHGNITVLPAPMVGAFRQWDERLVELNVDLVADASPVLLERMVERLATFADTIVWAVIPDSRVAEILGEREFYPEVHWDKTVGTEVAVLVWRR